MNQKFYFCPHCGKIVEIVKETGVPTICCGESMRELIPGTVDASMEKHVPIYKVEDGKAFVSVGAVEHPMTKEHYIEWISITTTRGSRRKILTSLEKPEATFALLEDEEVLAVYAYCNLHGLWKS